MSNHGVKSFSHYNFNLSFQSVISVAFQIKVSIVFSKYDINGLIDQSNNTEVQEINKKNILINTYNLLGKKNPRHGFCFEIYDDGSVVKKYKLWEF